MRALFIKKPGPTGLTITNMIRFIIGLFALFGLSQAEPGFTPDGFGDAFQDALSELPANRRDAFVRSLNSLQDQLDQWQMGPMRKRGMSLLNNFSKPNGRFVRY